jgi:hypothetical protein
MEMLVELYCSVDDFWKDFSKQWEQHLLTKGRSLRGPKAKMSVPEMMTISILFHQSSYRNFKHFYCNHVMIYLRKEFPTLISYSRFVYLLKSLFIPLFAYLVHNRGAVTGISFIDSTKIQVCHNKRIRRNKVFARFAKMGKTGAGWFFGFKLHLITNEVGEILAFQLTPGNTSDVSVADRLSQGIMGSLYGDKGYISEKLGKKLMDRGLQLFTNLRAKMKNKCMNLRDKMLLRKRVIIETINDQLKNISQIEHTRHRSVSNFLVNTLCAIAAYMRQSKKPRIRMSDEENLALAAC